MNNWIETSGSPFVIVEQQYAHQWKGQENYNAICSVTDYLGKIYIDNHVLLVMGDEPMATRIVNKDGAILIIRWKYAPDYLTVEKLLENDIVTGAEPIEEVEVKWDSTELVLFDSLSPYCEASVKVFLSLQKTSCIRKTPGFPVRFGLFSQKAAVFKFFSFIFAYTILTNKGHDTNLLLHYHDDNHRLPARLDPQRRMDRQKILRHRHPGTRQQKRRYDQHAAGAGTPGSPAGLSAGFPQGIRRGHIDRDPQIRRLHQRYVADKYQDHRRIRRRARTHLPHFRGIPGRQGRGNARGGDHGNLSAGRTALFRRMGRDPDDDALRFARVYRGRLLLSDLHDRFAQGKPIGAVHRLLIRHGRSAALHPPQKYRSAEKRHGIQNIHLEAPSKSGQIAR